MIICIGVGVVNVTTNQIAKLVGLIEDLVVDKEDQEEGNLSGKNFGNKGVIVVKAFIDSNVIANWVLVNAKYKEIHKIKKKIKKKKELKRFEEELEEYSYQKNAYNFLENLRKNNRKNIFFVSALVFNEVFSVILEEYVTRTLISKGIPTRFWSKNWKIYKEKTELSNDDSNDIVHGINDFIHIFVNKDIIKQAEEKYDKQTIVNLIIGFKCDTHDASICAIAVSNKCGYLITDDSRLKERLKECEMIKIISSEAFRLKFFK